jgi:hypothetical protein
MLTLHDLQQVSKIHRLNFVWNKYLTAVEEDAKGWNSDQFEKKY